MVVDNPVPVPPFIGTRVERGVALGEIARYLNETSLFRNQWGYRPLASENDAEFKTRVRAVLREKLDAARQADVLRPAVVYGYFAANSEGDDLIIWADEGRSRGSPASVFPGRTRARGCASLTFSGPPTPARRTTPHSTSCPWVLLRPRKQPNCSARTATAITCTCTAYWSR